MKYLENTMLTQLWDKIRRTFQTQTDNSLKTTSKTVIGAINELNGARKPIILTPSTTEVDEETYQKLLSDDVDVVFKSEDNLCILTFKTEDITSLSLVFTGLSLEGDTTDDLWFYGYDVSITKDSPHNCTINQWYNDTLSTFLGLSSFIDKSTLSPVLQEIDLTGTDADRKAKLDKFETDWKALTGAGDLRGARFVGYVDNTDNSGTCSVLFTFDYGSNSLYQGCTMASDTDKKIVRYTLDKNDGSLVLTPLFSHLEAITIYTDNTQEHMQANLDNIAAYEANLQALGVDTTKGYMIPITASGRNGFLSSRAGNYPYAGYVSADSSVNDFYNILILGNGEYYDSKIQSEVSGELHTISKQIVGAINEINANAVHSDKLVPTLEAITIGDNTPEGKAATKAVIEAYRDNLTALGVDVTKGFMIPIKSNNGNGFIFFDGTKGDGYIKVNNDCYGISITANYSVAVNNLISTITNYSTLNTTSKRVLLAINEVNALAKSKQDALTSGTNIKTVNGQSLLGSGDIAISGGGSAPALVDIDDISGSAGVSVSVDVFNKIANAASAKTPIFGYSKLVEGQRTTYEIIPLYVKNVSTPDTNGSLSIQFIAANAYNSVGIMKRSDTECSILISSSRPFALDTSVDKSSTRGIQSSAVWNEIHSEPMTVNTATSGVTILSSTDKHKILCYADSGTQQYNLPSSPVDGETFLFLKVKSGHTITIQSGTGNENIYDCSSGNSVVSKTIETSTKRKITVTYSSTVGKWFLMANDFLS